MNLIRLQWLIVLKIFAFLLLLVVAAVALGLSAVGASTSAVLTTASTSI